MEDPRERIFSKYDVSKVYDVENDTWLLPSSDALQAHWVHSRKFIWLNG